MPPIKGGKQPIPHMVGKGKGKVVATGGKDIMMRAGAKARYRKSSAMSKRRPQQYWGVYIRRALRQVYKTGSLSRRAVAVLSSFLEDMFSRIQQEAVHVARINKVRTLTAREIQTSARLLLPPELAKHAMSEGTKAVAQYNASREEML